MICDDLIHDMSYAIIYDFITMLERVTMLIPLIVPSKPGLNTNVIINLNLNVSMSTYNYAVRVREVLMRG